MPTLAGPGHGGHGDAGLLVPELWSLLTNDVGSLRFTQVGLVGGGSLRWPLTSSWPGVWHAKSARARQQ